LLSCTGTNICADERKAGDEQPGIEQLLGGSLLPSPGDERLRREHALAGELARTLEQLKGVLRARVHLSLADKSILSRRKISESSAAILIRRDEQDGGPELEEIRSLIVAAVPGLSKSRIEVFFTGSPSATYKTVFVGPIEVVESSATAARWCIGVLLVLCLILGLGLVLAGLTIRERRRTKAPFL
jgi:type III secretory pathway lipoprotein EscJ